MELIQRYQEELKWILHPLNDRDDKKHGKRPITPGWQKLAQSVPVKFPEFNVGLLTGRRNGITILDIDVQDNGLVEWNKFLKDYEEPKTVCAKTGSGGLHYFFKFNADIASVTKWTKKDESKVGWDIINENEDFGAKQIVICPSFNRVTNGKYEWIRSPFECDLLEFPQEIFDYIEENQFISKSILKENKKKERDLERDPSDNEEVSFNEVKFYVSCLKNKRSDDYSDWIKVGHILKNEGEEYRELWHEFSAKYDKYSEKECDKVWDGMKPHGKIKIGTLIHWAKEDSPEKFKKFKKQHNSITVKQELKNMFELKTENYPCFQVKNFDDKWVKPFGTYEQSQICEVIEAYLGRGKTKQCIELLKKVKGSAIILTSRRVFARCIHFEFDKAMPERNFVLYLNSNCSKIMNADNLVLQVESLLKINGKHFDIVIVDECESVLNQLTSISTHKENINVNQEIFVQLLKNAKRLIMMDAFLSNKTIDFLNDVKKPYVVNRYTYPPEERECEQYKFKDTFIERMVAFLHEGKKLFLFCSSKTQLLEVILPKIKNDIPDLKICEYHGKKTCTLKDVRKDWKKADFVCCTSTITVGCNYDIPDDFDSIWMYVSAASQNLVRDVFQSHMRVRHISSKKLHYYLDCRPIGCNLPVCRLEILNNLKFKIDCYKNNEQAELKKRFQDSEIHYKNLLTNNILEHNLSVMGLADVFDYYLEKCGYKKGEMNEIQFEVEWNDEKIENEISYRDIPELTWSEMDELKRKKMKGDVLTDLELMSIEKFFFQEFTFKSDIFKITEQLWDMYKNYGKGKFRFLSYEKGLSENRFTIEDLIREKISYNIFDDGHILKIQIVKRICELLDIKTTHDLRKIPRKQLQEMVDDMKKIKKKVHVIFGFRDRKKSNTFDIKDCVRLINEVLDRVGYSSLVRGKRNRKQVDGKRVDISDFEIKSEVKLQDDEIINVMDHIKPHKLGKRAKAIPEDEDDPLLNGYEVDENGFYFKKNKIIQVVP